MDEDDRDICWLRCSNLGKPFYPGGFPVFSCDEHNLSRYRNQWDDLKKRLKEFENST